MTGLLRTGAGIQGEDTMKKKFMAMLLALTLTAALLASCGDKDSKSEAKTSSVSDNQSVVTTLSQAAASNDSADFIGEWHAVSVTVSGNKTYDKDSFKQYAGYELSEMTVIINNDGTGKWSVPHGKFYFKWELEGKTLKYSYDTDVQGQEGMDNSTIYSAEIIDGELDFSWNADNGDQANGRFVKN